MSGIRYQIVSLDVWGDEHEGFELDMVHPTGMYILLSDDVPPSARQVVAALKAANRIKKNVRYASVGIYEAGDKLVVEDAKTGEPLFHLEPENEY